jgi:hypothetical protein
MQFVTVLWEGKQLNGYEDMLHEFAHFSDIC